MKTPRGIQTHRRTDALRLIKSLRRAKTPGLLLLFVVCSVAGASRQLPPESASSGSAAAKSAPPEGEPREGGPPGLAVVKIKWERQLSGPRNWDRPIFDARRPGVDNFPARDPTLGPPRINFPPVGRRRYVYSYSAKIRNDGAKKIRGIVWEYVLSDPESKKELGRHRFYSRTSVGAGKGKTLGGVTASPPTRTVSAAGLGKDKRSPYDERVEFRCVLYEDGTWWRRASAEESDCLPLKDRRQTRRRPRT